MKIIAGIMEMQRTANEYRMQGRTIGVVPTMGYLHEGHLSLIRLAKQRADIVITTLFVNSAQFGVNEDFNRYPRDFDRDTRLAESSGCDILFAPVHGEIYPENYLTVVEVGTITNLLEGKIRPTHFKGVATIVAKLFNITTPHVAVFGQKDAQQAVVIRQMIQDLNFDIDLIIAPIVRESDGLAMSSRNVYLSDVERKESLVLYQSLQAAKQFIDNGERQCSLIISEMRKIISSKQSAKVEYISIADADTLKEYSVLHDGNHALISLAVRFGQTRLIDNLLITI